MFNTMSGNHEFQISGDGVDRHPVGFITIDKVKGFVYLQQKIDREIYRGPFHVS